MKINKIPWDLIQPSLEVEETTNDGDKTISVPSGEEWKILWIHIEFTATSTSGNRRIRLDFRDEENDLIYRSFAINVQIADATEVYEWLPGITGPAEDYATLHTLPLPKDAVLRPSSDIRIQDNSNVASGFDDMIIQMMIKKRKVS